MKKIPIGKNRYVIAKTDDSGNVIIDEALCLKIIHSHSAGKKLKDEMRILLSILRNKKED